MKTDDTSNQERAALLVISEAVLEDYFAELPHFLSPEARKEWTLLQAYLAKRKQALLSPAPKKPRKPKAASLAVTELGASPPTAGMVIQVPIGLQHTDNAITKRGKR